MFMACRSFHLLLLLVFFCASPSLSLQLRGRNQGSVQADSRFSSSRSGLSTSHYGHSSSHSSSYSIYLRGFNNNEEVEGDAKLLKAGEILETLNSEASALHKQALIGWDIGVRSTKGDRSYPNQDNFFIQLFTEKNASDPSSNVATVGLFAIMDGHGEDGHLTSDLGVKMLRDQANSFFSNYTELIQTGKERMRSIPGMSSVVDDPALISAVEDQIFKSIIHEIYQSLEASVASVSRGGASLSLVMWDAIRSKLYVASAGDSEVLAKREGRLEPIATNHGASSEDVQRKLRRGILEYFNSWPKKLLDGSTLALHWETDNHSALDGDSVDSSSTASNMKNASELEGAEGEQSIAEGCEDSEDSTDTEGPSEDIMDQQTAENELAGISDKDINGTQRTTAVMDDMELFLSLPSINGQKIAKNSMPAAATLVYIAARLPTGAILLDFRIGGFRTSRGIGIGGRGPSVNSHSFCRADPDINVVDLSVDPLDFILIASEGLIAPFMRLASGEVYKDRVSACEKDCLVDPVEKFREWQESEETFSDEFDNAVVAFNEVVAGVARDLLRIVMHADSNEGEKGEDLVDRLIEYSTELAMMVPLANEEDKTVIVSIEVFDLNDFLQFVARK